MNYQQALDYIDGYTDYEKMPVPHTAANYDLRRVEELLDHLDNPHRFARSVHIGGTNGKGSTASMIASTLIASGYTTGLYTSPHLNTIRERVRVDGELISKKEFVSLVEGIKPEVEAVNERAKYGEITTFELLTVLAFSYFQLKRVDFMVLEVGLGGKYDATNVIQPEICIITSISLDHMEILGNSLAEIAAEKAGIIKPGSVVVLSPQSDEVMPVIEAACLRQGAELIKVGQDIKWQSISFDIGQQSLQIIGRSDNYQLSIPLLGNHQLENAATAVAALEVLERRGFNVSRESITSGLAQTHWAGRLQILEQSPIVVVDGAHNPGAARQLKQSLASYFNFCRSILVIGVSSDKDVTGVVSELVSFFDEVIITRSLHPRAMDLASLAAEFGRQGKTARTAETVSQALALARKIAGDRDLICVTGSLFVVAEAIKGTD